MHITKLPIITPQNIANLVSSSILLSFLFSLDRQCRMATLEVGIEPTTTAILHKRMQ